MMIDRKLRLLNLTFSLSHSNSTPTSTTHSRHFHRLQHSFRHQLIPHPITFPTRHHSSHHPNPHQKTKPKINYKIISPLIIIISTGLYYLHSSEDEPQSLKPNHYEKFKIEFLKPLTNTTNLYSIRINTNQIKPPTHAFYLQSIYIKHPELQIERSYTNLSTIRSNQSLTHIEFLIKSYADGEVSNYLKRFKSNKQNQAIEIRGPELNWCHSNDNLNEIVFIAGGTGITPAIQLLRRFYTEHINENSTNSIPKMKIIYLSKSKESIYLNEELLNYSNLYSNLVKVHKVVTQPFNGTESDISVDKIGKLEINDLKKWIGTGSNTINNQRIILVCGPDPMIKAIAGPKGHDMISQGELGGMLKELGYHPEEVYKL